MQGGEGLDLAVGLFEQLYQPFVRLRTHLRHLEPQVRVLLLQQGYVGQARHGAAVEEGVEL